MQLSKIKNKELLYTKFGKHEISIIFIIDQFLGHTLSYKWGSNKYYKCKYCGCPNNYINNFCTFPFLCSIYYDYFLVRKSITVERNYGIIFYYSTLLMNYIPSIKIDYSDKKLYDYIYMIDFLIEYTIGFMISMLSYNNSISTNEEIKIEKIKYNNKFNNLLL